jgi:hypothetical protein
LVGADLEHPGMTAVLGRVATEFGLTATPHPVPYANSFVCHRDEWFRLLDAFGSMLSAVLDRYGPHPPYRYRCRQCGTVSDTGSRRYTSTRHLAYLGERLTMLHFASRPDIHFVTPAAFGLRAPGALRARARLHTVMRARGIRFPWRGRAMARIEGNGPPCPGCAA